MIEGSEDRSAQIDASSTALKALIMCRGIQSAQCIRNDDPAYDPRLAFDDSPAMTSLDHSALAQLFTEARTHNAWKPDPIDDATLERLHELLKWAPTSANCSPGRFVFVKSRAGKERLRPAMDEGNLEKTMIAPVTVIVATDFEFYKNLPRLFPHAPDSRSWFEGKPAAIETGGFRNGTLQGAYLLMAARALGLDCGPMSGFNNALVDAEFFAGTAIRSNFLVNLGHGDPAGVFPRSPRLAFSEACEIV